MTASLADKIKQAVATGKQPDISLDELLSQESLLPGPTRVIAIDIADLPPLSDVYRIASLVPGLPIGQWLPKVDFLDNVFANGVAQLDRVAFTVDPKAKSILCIALRLNLGSPGNPITLGSDFLSAGVTRLDLAFYPGFLSATVVHLVGSLTIGKLKLDCTLSCPGLVLTAALQPADVVNLSDLAAAFKLPTPPEFENLIVSELDLAFNISDRTASFNAGAATQKGEALSIIDGVLGLDMIDVGLSYAPSSVSMTLDAALTVMDAVVLGVQVSGARASGGTPQDWSIAGGIDFPSTALALQKKIGDDKVSVANLIRGVLGITLPSAFDFLNGIELLTLNGSVTFGSSRTWSLDVAGDIEWQLGGTVKFKADTTVHVGDSGKGKTGSVTADLRIGEDDGPGLSLEVEYTCATDSKEIKITLPQLLGTTIDYTMGAEQLTVTLGKDKDKTGKTPLPPTLGNLISGVAGIFTGNPYVALPSPWGDILNAIQLPPIKVTIDLKTKAVTFEADTTIEFFGNTITGIAIGYDPTKAAGDRISFTVLGTFPILQPDPTKDPVKDPTWDPTKPGAAPAVPGQGSKLVDIQLVAAGQRVQLALPPNPKVEDAVSAIAGIARTAGGSDPDKLPPFDSSAGWLVATHIVFKSAIDFQLVFADPAIYGAVIKIAKQDDTPPAIQALDGLYLEILYRKVTSSIGVYEGLLTLPDKIRKIDYGAFELQLPSIAVDIYTNGDFLIDVGFPHNGDFSKSAVINAGEYVGAGGVYYGHLSGSTASALPPIPQVTIDGRNLPIGTFNTVTEIGIGLRVGIGKSYSQGPLSASVYVVIQAIFEGLFSTYTQFPLPAHGNRQAGVAHPEYPVTTEYYKIVASLGIVGQLQGSIDFAIVSASLLVQIQLIATVHAESYKAVQVEGEVDVHVELTVRINLGLFKISIHCGFSTTIRFSTQFGSDSAVLPWSAPTALRTVRALALHAEPPLQLDFEAPPCQGIATALYVVPQLSRGLADVTKPGGAVDWIYTVQFALPIDAPAAPSGTFADFARFVTAWAVDAMWRHNGSPKTPDEFYASLTIDPTRTYDPSLDRPISPIDRLIDALKAIPKNPDTFDTALAAFFDRNQFALGTLPDSPGANDQGTHVGFFPILPPLVVNAVGGTIAPAVADVPAQVLRAYVVLVATSVLDAVQKKITTPSTLADAYAALGDTGLAGAVGMATRFMLHGTRYAGTSAQPLTPQPLYRATGQEMSVSLNAPTLSVTVTGPNAGAWGVSIPSGTFTLSSADNQLHAASAIQKFRSTISAGGITAGTMPSSLVAPARFAVKPGFAAPVSLRALPSSLMAWAGKSASFSLFDANDRPVQTGWSWCSTIDFRVQRVPDPARADDSVQKLADPAKPSGFLPDVYALVAVRGDGLERLEKIYKACNGTPNFTGLDIVYGVAAGQTTGGNTAPPTFVAVDPQRTFLFQSNISTETNPPRVALLMMRPRAASATSANDPRLTFLGRLLTGGLTNSGGYYVYLKPDSPPPAAMFDTSGMAWLTLAVYGFTDNSGSIAAYYNALRITDQACSGDAVITLQSPSDREPQATIATGVIGTQISRPDWSGEDDTLYQCSLDGLFNLIDCEPVGFVPAPGGSAWTVLPGRGHVVGPIKIDETTTGPHIYRAQFDLLGIIGRAPDVRPNAPDDALNPYQFTGAQLQLAYRWVDFYGNTLPPGFTGTPLAIGLVDPLTGLDDWPGLSYGFAVTDAGGSPQLVVDMTYVPRNGGPIDEPTYRQYIKIFHQLKTTTVTAQASFVKSQLTSIGATSAAEVLRGNVRTIIAAVAATAPTPLQLTPLVFPLPTPISGANYNDDLLQRLTVSLCFLRPGPVASGLESRTDILNKQTALAPFQDTTAQGRPAGAPARSSPPLGYRKFATDLERTLKDLGVRVMGGDLDVPGGSKFWLLRWQGGGLQIGFKPGGMGFAPTPIATALQSRTDIEQAMFTQQYKFPGSYLGKLDWPLAVTDMDMDSVLAAFLAAIEDFLSPARAIPAAIAAPDHVDACIAQKQSLAQKLAARVTALSGGADPDQQARQDAAVNRYQQACLIDLRNFYALDAAAALTLTATNPSSQALQDLIVYGHCSMPQNSDVQLSAGQARLSAGAGQSSAVMALSLAARHQNWKAAFTLPDSFRIEALELVDDTIDVLDPDGPAGKPRKYILGTWLRFITDDDLDLKLGSPPPIPLPLRSYPLAPALSAQGYSQLPGTQLDSVTKLDSVKSWSLDSTYRHQYAAQDTVHITAVLNEPAQVSRLLALASRPIDLLDGLVLFQAIYPAIRAEFDTNLRLDGGVLKPQTLDAITSFVLLVQCVAENLAYTPKGGRVAGGVAGGSTFELVEHFDGDPAKATWQATLTRTSGTDSLCPAPIVVIDRTPAGQTASDATLYSGVPVQDSEHPEIYNIARFCNKPGPGGGPPQPLVASDALGNPIRSLQIQPLDIVDWHSGRYYLQIVRNQSLPRGFQYVTPLIAARDRVLPLIDNADADVDLTRWPSIHYDQGGPPAGSFGDVLARFYCALLNGKRSNPERPPGGMRTGIALRYPLIPGAPAPDVLPDVRVPVVLQLLATGFTFYPSPDQSWAMARPLADKVAAWLQDNGVSASQRPDLYKSARLDVSVTVFSAASETSLPMIYLDGLYLNLRDLKS